MARLTLEHVSVEYPVYQASHRTAKKVLLKSLVGGAIGRSAESGHLVVRGIQDINIDLVSGERLAILGHNGAGKTTLLRTMAGIYAPIGRVSAEGARVPLFDIGIGFDEEATGYENIVLRGLLLGLKRKDIERRVDEIAAFSELGEFLDLPMRTYSSGMLFRLLFSIATSVDADILLMDEWIATGDRDFLAKADLRLRDVIDRSQILILASHNFQLLQSLCNRAILLEEGRIAFEGAVEEAIARYSGRGGASAGPTSDAP